MLAHQTQPKLTPLLDFCFLFIEISLVTNIKKQCYSAILNLNWWGVNTFQFLPWDRDLIPEENSAGYSNWEDQINTKQTHMPHALDGKSVWNPVSDNKYRFIVLKMTTQLRQWSSMLVKNLFYKVVMYHFRVYIPKKQPAY